MLSTTRWAALLFSVALLAACGGGGGGGGGNGPNPTPDTSGTDFNTLPKGSFALQLNRSGSGTLPGDQAIYVQLINIMPDKITYAVIDSSHHVVNGPLGNASLGVIKNAQPNMVIPSFKLSELLNKNLILPGDGKYYGTRIYFSVGKPLTMTVTNNNTGYIQPNIDDPADPNYATPYDWLEIAYDGIPQPANPALATVAFGMNITQVDAFSIPLSYTLMGVKGTSASRGITLGSNSSSGATTRDDVMRLYSKNVSLPFQDLKQVVNGQIVRLIAPFHSSAFKPGGAYANYFDGYVDQVWNYIAQNPFTVYDQINNVGNQYTVSADSNNNLLIYRNNFGPFLMQKPSTYEIFSNSGHLQPGGMEVNAFGAMLSGALNRHVATASTASWYQPSAFYQQEPSNDWAKFWHQVSVGGLAYGFGFDDSANQSSVAILPADENPLSLKVNVGW